MAVHRSRSGGSGAGGFDLQIVGAEQLTALGKSLRGADKAYRKALRMGVNRITKPPKTKVKDNVPRYMPSGYAPLLSKSLRLRTLLRTGGLASVRIVAVAKGKSKNRDIRALDRGVLRKPVFGRYRRSRRGLVANPWAVQRVRGGFWSEPVAQSAPEVREELIGLIADVNTQLAKGKTT